MPFKNPQRSAFRLKGVHPDLVSVIMKCAAETDMVFDVTEGLRTLARQKKLVAQGASKTLRSLHIPDENGIGHAFDIVCYAAGKVTWSFPVYMKLARVMKRAAKELGVPITWGGDWRTFKDGPHYQLPRGYSGSSQTPPPTAAEKKTIHAGATGALVVKLQKALQRHAIKVVSDGDFGMKTDAAVRKFQKIKGLKADGWVGSKTWKALLA